MKNETPTGEKPAEPMGTWLRGADGSLYFIPDNDLDSYRVPDDQVGSVLQEVDALGEKDLPSTLENEPIVATRAVATLGGGGDLAARPAIVPPPPKLRGLRWPRR